MPHVSPSNGRKNILYFIADDFRPEINGPYNKTYMSTPNLDKLAGEGVAFLQANTQQSVCCPTRSSFLTGRTPSKTRVWDNTGEWRRDGVNAGEWLSLPGTFMNAGYLTLGGGKTFHRGGVDGARSFNISFLPYFPFVYNLRDGHCPNKASTSSKDFDGLENLYAFAEEDMKADPQDSYELGNPWSGIDTWCPLNLTDDHFYDALLSNWTTHEALPKARDHMQETGDPFFLVIGFLRPHVPYRVPQRYFDMYSSIAHPSPYQTTATNYPDICFHQQGLYKYPNLTEGWVSTPTTPMPLDVQQVGRQAYMASVSWMDEQLGRVLSTLENLGLSEDTLVIHHGDHAYSLSDSNLIWHKEFTEEAGVRVPLIYHVPWEESARGVSHTPVNLVDNLATIAELVNVTLESNQDYDSKSYAQDVLHPSDTKTTMGFTQFPRCIHKGMPAWNSDNMSCGRGDKSVAAYFMEYGIRTLEYRATFVMNWDPIANSTDWNQAPNATELYDHRQDNGLQPFGSVERDNIAAEASSKPIVESLFSSAKEYFTSVQPN